MLSEEQINKIGDHLREIGFNDNNDYNIISCNDMFGNIVGPCMYLKQDNLVILLDIIGRDLLINELYKKKTNMLRLDLQSAYVNLDAYTRLSEEGEEVRYCLAYASTKSDYEELMNITSYTDILEKYEIKKEYDFYVAGPFFNEAQLESMEKIEEVLAKHGKTMFRPRLDAGKIDMKTASDKDILDTFINDVEGILKSRYIITNVTFPDTGTSFEYGYAFANHVPIICFNDVDTSGKKMNLMLAQSAEVACTSYDDLDRYFAGKEREEAVKFDIE